VGEGPFAVYGEKEVEVVALGIDSFQERGDEGFTRRLASL
jgi:hypothetical protein